MLIRMKKVRYVQVMLPYSQRRKSTADVASLRIPISQVLIAEDRRSQSSQSLTSQKGKIRVLEQRDSTDENGSSGRHGVVESNSYKVTDVKAGSVRVYRLMDASTIPEWIEEDD